MKILKIIKSCRSVTEDEIKSFIYRNMSQEMIAGLEYDDPKTIVRALRLFGIDPTLALVEERDDKNQLLIRKKSA